MRSATAWSISSWQSCHSTLSSSAPLQRLAPTYKCFREKCGLSVSESQTRPRSVSPGSWRKPRVSQQLRGR